MLFCCQKNMTKIDSVQNSEILNVLQTFGFTLLQAKVYLNLLSLGTTTAGPLVKRVGAHRQLVYSALEFLESENFVSIVIKNNRKVFSAARPEILMERESLRMKSLQSAIPKLQKLIPQANSNVHIEALTGKEEFIRRLSSLVDSAARTDGVIRIIADVRDVDVYAVMGSAYQEYKRYQGEKNVKKYVIAPECSVTDSYHNRLVKEVGSSLRISLHTPTMPTSICFTSEVVCFDIFSEDVVTIMVWNPSVAKSFKAHFEVLWKTAVPFKKYIKSKI